ncbi:MAG: 3-methyl-2-oxobutanoate hydroxymethyltransferase [Gammaproteobacteria bacterium]
MSSYSSISVVKPISIDTLQAMKRHGEKISCLTAYDASFSAVIDKVGIDVILVGDSLGMVIQGQSTTIPVLIEDMVYHTRCVSRGRQRAFVIADLPFLTYATPDAAAENAARLMQAGGAQMVKLEGERPELVSFLAQQGVPVCGHLGLLPQSINRLGGYKVQGRAQADADTIMKGAVVLEDAGASMLVLECVPAELGREISQRLTIPVIGIGAGPDCDGQVLVLYDVLNIGIGKHPRFSKDFMQDAANIEMAIHNYHKAVKQEEFPSVEHSF